MIEALPKEFLQVISSNDNLHRYLVGLTRGKPFTKRSWLYEDESDIAVREHWMKRLSKLKDGNAFERNVFQFDTSQMEKWGPQGGVQPVQKLMSEVVLPSFEKAHSPVPEAFETDDWAKAKEECIINFKKHGIRGLRPASYSNVVDDMRARDTLESNSGWPDFKRRNIPEVVSAAVAAAQDGRWKQYPAIALFRNYRQKTRLVWMFPMATNVYEGSYFQPLQSSIVKAQIPFYAPWVGFEAVRSLITRAFDSGLSVAASDFSETDQHFVPRSTFEVFDVLAPLMTPESRSGLRVSFSMMHKIPLIVGPNQMVTGDHGVSSGSNWTNFDESIFDEVFARYTSRHTSYRGLYAIGDDMAWVTDRWEKTFNQELEELGLKVGQVIKPDKTTNDRDKVKTLQRLFQRGYRRPDKQLRGVYSTIRALNSSLFPERYHDPRKWSSDMFCARQYMILENCVDHPLFEEFVDFVVHGQRDLIPFARKSKRELDDILRKTKLLPGLNTTYNQEKRDQSLANFASIRLARKM